MYIKKDILGKYKVLENNFNKKEDKKLLYDAFIFAYKDQKNQKNIDGQEIIIHLINTTEIALLITKDIKIALFSLLHHCLELNKKQKEQLEKKFGKEIIKFINGFYNLKNIEYKKGEIINNPNLFNYFLKLANNDIRVFLIKICSRLDYIKNIEKLEKKLRKKIALETLELYIPLIRLFGLNRYILDIEDICFKNIEANKYNNIKKIIDEKKEFLEQKISQVKKIIYKLAKKHNIEIKLEARIKSIYSLARKMEFKNVSISGIYDLLAFRIITNTKDEAYIFLGLIHSVFKSKENRIKDYISAPKPNGYQSIHTTVIDIQGYIFEIQIQTKQMYEFNIFGMASHNLYKGSIKNPKSYPEWMKKIHNDKKKIISGYNLSELFNTTFASHKITCYTPTGTAIEIPKNSTIIDCAFKIHSDFGKRLKGAWVNGEYIKDLVYKLKDNDKVKLELDKKEAKFKINFLSKVKTKIAKKHIIETFKNKGEEKVKQLGKFLLNERINLLDFQDFEKLPKIIKNKILEKNNLNSVGDLYYEIGIGNILVDKIIKLINNIEEVQGKYKKTIKLSIKFKLKNHKNINGIFEIMHNHNANIINIDYRGIIAEIEINVINLEILNQIIVELTRLTNVYKVKRILSTKMKKFIYIFSGFTFWTLINPLILLYLDLSISVGSIFYKGFFYFNIILFIAMIYLLKNIAKNSLPGIISQKFFWIMMFGLNTFNLFVIIFESIYILKDTNIILIFSIIILLYGLTLFEYFDSKNKMIEKN